MVARDRTRWGIGRARAAAVCFALVALVAVVPAVGASGAIPIGTSSAASAPSHSTPYIQHVVMILLENQGVSNVLTYGPYESYLAGTYGNATNFYAACHPSAPNYMALVAAVTNQCSSDNWNNYTNRTLGTLLQHQGLTWAAFAEGLPSGACSSPGTATAGLFATRHVPFLYFANDLQRPGYCHQHLQVGDKFRSDVANGSLANYTFYTPNLCDDGHNGCGGNTTSAQMVRQADTWLKGFLGPILNHTGRYSTAPERRLVAHTVFVVTYDEGAGASPNAGYAVSGVTSGDNFAYCKANGASGDAVCGGHVFAVFISPYSLGRSFTTADSDYGLVATVEWLFHLGHLRNPGGYDASAGFPVMKSLFSFKRNS